MDKIQDDENIKVDENTVEELTNGKGDSDE